MAIGESTGQGWEQVGALGAALLLSALIGLEREIRQKSAGLRTHSLVGLASALIMLISKFGFSDVLVAGRVVLDPARVAAQVVSGIGFIGGGLIFVKRDTVRGLTTAASIWLAAAVGMACGAGLPLLALVVTAGHFLVVFVFPVLVRRLPQSRWAASSIQISYVEGRGILRHVLVTCTSSGFTLSRVGVERHPQTGSGPGSALMETNAGAQDRSDAPLTPQGHSIVTVDLEVQGASPVSDLVAKLVDIDGIVAVNAGDVNVASE